MPTELYRHYDEQDRLLYVGVALSAIHRLSQHRDHSTWFEKIKRVEIQTFETRKEALEAERQAITEERPKHNMIHKRPEKEEEQQKQRKTRKRQTPAAYIVAKWRDKYCQKENVSSVLPETAEARKIRILAVLSKSLIKSLKAGKARREIRDVGCPSLYLVIQTSGAKSWAMRFRRPSGRPGKLTLGPVDLTGAEQEGGPLVIGQFLTLEQARALAAEIHRDRARGKDVIGDYQAAHLNKKKPSPAGETGEG
jgi:hypothetical protein